MTSQPLSQLGEVGQSLGDHGTGGSDLRDGIAHVITGTLTVRDRKFSECSCGRFTELSNGVAAYCFYGSVLADYASELEDAARLLALALERRERRLRVAEREADTAARAVRRLVRRAA